MNPDHAAPPAQPPAAPPAALARQLGLSAAVAVIIGETIGVGIFLTPAGMARDLGAPFWLLLVWLIMALMALCGALCYGELAARFPAAGGAYVYLREAFGERTAFLYGWMALLVMDPGITAALGMGFSSYLGYVVPMGPAAAKAAAMAAILIVAGLNIVGTRQSAGVVRGLTVLKVAFLAFIALMALGLRLGDLGHFTPFVARPPEAGSLFGAMAGGVVGAFFAFGGWWDVSKLTGELRDPARNMPRALVLGVSLVTVIYIVTSAVFIYLVAPQQADSGEAFVAQAGTLLFGASGGLIFAVIVMVSVLSSLAGLLMAAPRVTYAMARDGLFLPSFGRPHGRFGTPARAIAIQALLACVLVALGRFDQVLAYFIFITVVFLGLTAAALFVLRRRGGPAPAYLTPGYPLTPLLYLLLVVVLLVLLAGHDPMQALLGTAVVAAGIPVHAMLFRR
ncbi:MAG TPA: amino acid permease, partial [Anaerolineae bacterium]|nr:amino acid permease [Anaerolineae bacterium]